MVVTGWWCSDAIVEIVSPELGTLSCVQSVTVRGANINLALRFNAHSVDDMNYALFLQRGRAMHTWYDDYGHSFSWSLFEGRWIAFIQLWNGTALFGQQIDKYNLFSVLSLGQALLDL